MKNISWPKIRLTREYRWSADECKDKRPSLLFLQVGEGDKYDHREKALLFEGMAMAMAKGFDA
jgi:hypothetical protein